ncbi:MAG: flagellar biosynthesis protein FlhA [Acidimicrobiia bacterium]
MRANSVGQVAIPAAVVAIIVMMVVPLPPMLIDFLLVVNITFAVMTLLSSMFVRRALDFSIFPSFLLIATLFRLALNICVTRLVLLHGYAGKVVESFGHFVVGGSIVVGLVVFLILIVIQFVVITNGAGRVAEVAARFTLDAMPGKQMAIDADLNAGIIDETEARRRRKEIGDEADFYGAMDGASKFVKGDAIAAIIIVLVNLLGGFAVGVLQKHMSISDAISTYSLLTVGDGLVSQIPALLISMSAGLIVTRAATEADLGSDLLEQFTQHRRVLRVGGATIALLAFVPGLPKLPFFVVGMIALFLSTRIVETILPSPEQIKAEQEAAARAAAAHAPDSPEALASEMRVEPLELELAFDLVDLVDGSRGGDLLDRVRALRRKLAMELGVVMPFVRTRDNLDLPSSTYAIRVHGVELGRGEAPPGCALVIGDDLEALPGTPTREPVFGLPALWLPVEFKHQAELAGATVVDRASVVTTHLAEIARRHASRLLSRQDVKMLMEMVRASDPAVADEVTGANLSLGEIQRVLQGLLDEGVAVRDFVRICEVLSERARLTKDTEALTEAVRAALGPAISASHAAENALPILTIDPLTEQHLLESLRAGDGSTFLAVDPALGEQLAHEIAALADQAERVGYQPVLVCSPQLRPSLHRLVQAAAPRVPVLSYAELGPQLTLETLGVVNLAQATPV